LESFDINHDIKEKTLSQVKASDIINTISSFESKFTTLFEDLRTNIAELFLKFGEKIDDSTKDINFNDGFSLENQLRHLTDYQLNSIEKPFSLIESKYKTFTKNVSESSQYIKLISNKNKLISGLQLPSSTLTNEFYAYKILIEQYTNNKKINTYFDQLERYAEEIRTEVITFIIDFSKKIDSNLNIIYFELRDSWNKTRETVNQEIYKSLDTLFQNKLSKLVDTTFNESLVFNTITIEPFNVNSKRNETLATISIEIKNINAKYGYTIKKKGTYDFMLHLYTGGDITLDITTYINDTLIETISGTLGSGEVGINANYTLHDLSLELEAYAKSNETNYSLYATKVNEDIKIYDDSPYTPYRNFNMKRTIRSLLFD